MIELIIISFLLGLSFGSFANVCIYRLPKGISVIKRRSFCPNCNQQLRWFELLPVVSYVTSQGKCRHCGERISLQYPIIELLVGVVTVLVVICFGISMHAIEVLFYFLLMLIVAIIDWKHFIIPNQVVIIGLVSGFLLKGFAGRELLLNAFIGSLSAFTILFSIRILGDYYFKKPSMGWGDVKLAAVVGLFLGFQDFLISLWLAALIGSIFGITIIRKESKTADIAIALGSIQLGAVRHIPFGAFLAGTSVLVFFLQPFIHSLVEAWLISIL